MFVDERRRSSSSTTTRSKLLQGHHALAHARACSREYQLDADASAARVDDRTIAMSAAERALDLGARTSALLGRVLASSSAGGGPLRRRTSRSLHADLRRGAARGAPGCADSGVASARPAERRNPQPPRELEGRRVRAADARSRSSAARGPGDGRAVPRLPRRGRALARGGALAAAGAPPRYRLRRRALRRARSSAASPGRFEYTRLRLLAGDDRDRARRAGPSASSSSNDLFANELDLARLRRHRRRRARRRDRRVGGRARRRCSARVRRTCCCTGSRSPRRARMSTSSAATAAS